MSNSGYSLSFNHSEIHIFDIQDWGPGQVFQFVSITLTNKRDIVGRLLTSIRYQLAMVLTCMPLGVQQCVVRDSVRWVTVAASTPEPAGA